MLTKSSTASNFLPVPLAATTLTFTSDGSWSDGVAEDGEGGSINIPGITIQIRNITDINGANQGSMAWKAHNFLNSGDANFTALTYEDNAGSKGMSIKSSDGGNFQLNSFRYYNWGEAKDFTNMVKGFRDGVEVASMTFNGYIDGYIPITVSLDNTFDNVDDVRLYITEGGYLGTQASTNHSINNIVIDAASPLPVTLVNFSAKTSESNIQLAWRTTSETNASHFEIERSGDGKSFANIGRVNAKGESKVLETYNFTDIYNVSTASSLQYYRLKMIDNDGTYAYSRMAAARWNNVEAVHNVIISPNPARNSSQELSLRFEGLSKGNYTVQIINLLGQKRAEKTFVWDGVSDSKLSTSNLSEGLYLVKTVYSGEEIVRRLVIQ
ncbi:MAG: T9SS type A sorting domain-containing protein [Dyadobacter sp.]